MKMIPLPRIKWILSLSLILAALSLVWCYNAFAKSRGADVHSPNLAVPVSPAAQVRDSRSSPDSDGDLDSEIRRQYLNRLLGTFPPGMSRDTYVSALAAALALPSSPLLQGRKFVLAEPPAPDMSTPPWMFPALYPISTPPPVTACAAWTHAIAAHPTNSSAVYIGGYGGLAKSANGGTNWQYLSDTWLSQEVSAIAIDPNAPESVFVGTGRDYAPAGFGLYRSQNGGATWARFGVTEFAGTVINAVAIDKNVFGSKQGPIVYVANGLSSTSGLWRSANGGQTWTRLRQGPNPYYGISDIAIDPSTNPSTLYIVEGDGVFMSTDNAGSWSSIFTTPGTLRVVNSVPYLMAPGGNPYANRLYKRVNQTWTEIETRCDAGTIWCAEGDPIGASLFAVDPNNSSVILVGREILFRTANANAQSPTWTHLGFDNMHVDQRALTFSPALSGLVYSGNDGGVLKSLRSGESNTWLNLNQNLPGLLPYSVGISRDDSMVTGNQDNGTVFSKGGIPWHMLWIGDSGHTLIDPNPLSGNTIYFTVGWNAQSYWIRADNPDVGGPGEVWANVRPVPLNAELSAGLCSYVPSFSMNPSIPHNLVAACQTVVQSTDRGDTWRAVGAPIGGGAQSTAVSVVYEAPSNPNIIYAAVPASTDRVFVTANAASPAPTWTDITGTPGSGGLPAGSKIGAVIVHPTNPQIVYVGGDSGIYKSTTMGPPWVSMSAPTGNVYTALAIDPANTTHIFAATRLAGVFATSNESTWGPINAGMPVGMFVSALSFNGTSRQLAASTYGRGVYILDLDDVPPAVVLTTPANGATVSGIVTISATASDNHRVAGVQFQLNGANLQGEDTSYPYSIDWNTILIPTGTHTLTAVARDPSGNTMTSAPVTVKVTRD